MSLTLGLWLFIVVFFGGFWAWTSYVVVRQIQAWKTYAKKRNLRFHSNGFLETPSLSGAVDGYKVSVFASEHSELDARSQRRLTAIEINMHTGLPVATAVASGGMVPVIEPLDLSQEYKPSHKKWDNSYIMRTRDNKVLTHYWNEERLQSVLGLMEEENAWVVLLFLSDTGLLRLDTPLALDNPRELDRVVKKMIAAIKVLELHAGEAESLIRKRSKSADSDGVLDVNEGLLIDGIGLELEEDDVEKG